MGQSGLGKRIGIFLGPCVLVGVLAGVPCRADEDISKKTSVNSTTSEADKTVRTQARRSYALGQKAFLENNFDAAEVYFRQAHDLMPHPSTLKMIAECYVAMGDVAAAVTIMEALLEEEKYINRSQLQDRIAVLRKQVGVLEIKTVPEGGRIEINNILLAEWGHAVVNVDPGRVTVVVTQQGKRTTREVRVAAGERKKLVVDSNNDNNDARSNAIAAKTDENANDACENVASEERIAHIAPEALGPESEELPRAFWIASAVAGFGLVSGTVFGTMALRDQQDFDEAPKQGTRNSGRRAAIIADMSFGLALGAAVAGTIVLISENRKKNRKRQARRNDAGMTMWPMVRSDGGGIAAGVSF